ncbi:wall-associated receptor kinase 2-like [Juglans microcarpa x Juglans regia]|uniref:wall-associated receptor kinase 2-like n=1 Tax=Juglans microcarpa x Juglans regia TaxID=2249226 RepID=UPI001B7DABAF|nr:wall-associated receptor kinase 2-like [Juglans microcarpa x Juglans regia]
MFLQITCVVLILSELAAAAVAAPLAKPNCPDRCGDVEIPYPFGTTKDCYLNKGFLITCTEPSSSPAQPLFGNVVVTNISIDGQLDILNFISFQCFKNSSGVLDDDNEPSLRVLNFTISNTKNKFVAVGCDTYAFLHAFQNNEPFSIGCTSTCQSLRNVVDGSSCSGIGCCQVDIPKGLKNFTLDARSYDEHVTVGSFNPCSYAFVAKQDGFYFSSDYLESLRGNKTYPMVLDWAIGDTTCEIAEHQPGYVCGRNSQCYNSQNGDGYLCECISEGYEGNPYLEDGCQDVNECEADQNPCNTTTSTCKNTDGNFTCICLDGYEGDGKITSGILGCRPIARANKSSINIIIPLAISIGLVGLFVGGSSIYCGLERRKLIKLKEKFFQQNGGLLLQQKLSNYRASMETTKIFSAEELQNATNNYDESRVLGQGSFGIVYRGILPDNKIVAIKKSKICDRTQIEQFINEVIVLTQINHRNVVRMLGCCLETEVPLLVYEFITNGTLSSHIHDKNLSSSLSWEKRLKIASETAGALAYLHSSTSVPIIHRDVKPANILLDDNYSAKVADFGTSILVPLDQTELSTLVKGTFGYLDPEYFYSNQLTEKSDVYSFGVVVAELLTGKKALSFDRPEKDRSLAMYFNSAVKEDRLHQILDDQIVNDVNINAIDEVANIAKWCLSVRGEDRPTMKEVAMELEGLRIMGKHPWVKADLYTEETESLLGPPTHSFNIDVYNGSSSTITTAGLESMRTQVVKPLDHDGR